MSDYAKPLPRIDDRNKPYWDSLKKHELRLARCTSCDTLRYVPYRQCPRCGSEDVEWARMSGRGTIWSRGFFHQVYFEGFRNEVPYNVAVVELEEGVRLYTNIVEAPNEAIEIGRPVEAVFSDVTPEVTLLKFRLVDRVGRK